MKRETWFFTSDWHLDHGNIIKYCDRRLFMSEVEQGLMDLIQRGTIPTSDLKISAESIQKMNDMIIDSTNAVVGPDDVLVHLGDFIFAPRHKLFNRLYEFREKIRCKNIYLIWGNHDDNLRDLYEHKGFYAKESSVQSAQVRAMFAGAYDQYLFNVKGQKIHCNHYPARSWDCAFHGSWMLYGHVHNLYQHEDNGKLHPANENYLKKEFEKHLWSANLGDKLDETSKNQLIQQLIDSVASLNGTDLTVDVGVDNTIRPNVPWGTPWSEYDLKEYMSKKTKRHS